MRLGLPCSPSSVHRSPVSVHPSPVFLPSPVSRLPSVLLRVLLFASYAEAVGAPELTVDVPDGSRVRDILTHVRELVGAHTLPPAPLVAVNAAYANPESPVSPGDEVAIIPPVAGG
jgi:molybdopterin converting factor subunit 1